MRELIGWVFAGLLFFAAGASAGAADAEVSEFGFRRVTAFCICR